MKTCTFAPPLRACTDKPVGFCMRCSQHNKPTDELVELKAGCGCIDRYCLDCRTTPAHDSLHGKYLSMRAWLLSLGKMHRQQGGRYCEIPCPSSWNHPAVIERDYRSDGHRPIGEVLGESPLP